MKAKAAYVFYFSMDPRNALAYLAVARVYREQVKAAATRVYVSVSDFTNHPTPHRGDTVPNAACRGVDAGVWERDEGSAGCETLWRSFGGAGRRSIARCQAKMQKATSADRILCSFYLSSMGHAEEAGGENGREHGVVDCKLKQSALVLLHGVQIVLDSHFSV